VGSAALGMILPPLARRLGRPVTRGLWPWLMGLTLAGFNILVFTLNPGRMVPVWGSDGIALPFLISFPPGYALLSYLLSQQQQRRRIETALEDERRRFHAVFDQSLQHHAILDPSGRIIAVNRSGAEPLGGVPEAAAIMPLWAAPWPISPEEREIMRRSIQAAAGGQITRFTVTLRRPAKPSPIHVDYTVTPIHDDFGQIVLLSAEGRDISRRTQAEAKLQDSEARYAAFFENTADPLFVLDVRTPRLLMIESVNPAFQAITGFSGDDLLGKPLASILVETDQALLAHVDLVMERATPAVIEMALTFPSGTRSWALMLVPILDGSGRVELIIANSRDVTEQRRQEAALRQTQKMEAVGQITGGVAHDFNNLLTVIAGNLDLIERRLTGDDPPIRRHVDSALRAVQRAERLTQQLLAFSRKQELAPEPVDLNRLIGNISDMLHQSLGESIEIEMIAGQGLWHCLVDPHQVELALLNLAINGRDAMGGTGKLTIETANFVLDSGFGHQESEVEFGPYVMLSVADRGTGMTPEVAAHAFEPFFTTKDVGEGSGLGLSMVYGFVAQSQGHIRIATEAGHGTTILLYLPRFDTSLPQIEEA
jgi:PAS domain S-box-containing protein